MEWRELDGGPVDWRDPHLGAICLVLRGSAEGPEEDQGVETLALVFNGRDGDMPINLPGAPAGMGWTQVLDTASADMSGKVPCLDGRGVARGQSVMVFVLGHTDG